MHHPPTSTQPSSRRFIVALAVVVSFTALLSILVLAFKSDGAHSYSDTTQGGLSNPSIPIDGVIGELALSLYPQMLDPSNLKITLAGAGITLMLAVAIGGLGVFVHRRAKALLLSERQRRGLFFTLGGNGILILVVSMIRLVRHFQSAKFDPDYRSPYTNYKSYGSNDEYDSGTFDLASWACQVSAYNGGVYFNKNFHVLSRQCIDETAALWIGLLLALSYLGMVGLVWKDWRGPRILIRDSSSIRYDWEDDYT